MRGRGVALVQVCAGLRPGTDPDVPAATKLALRTLARRVLELDAEIDLLDATLRPLVTATAPALVAAYGVGPDTTGALLVAAGDNPERLRTEACFARLCGVAPIEASSGKVTRHWLHRGGDPQANSALWRIVITRMSNHPETRTYVERRDTEGRSKKEIIRCLKRYTARELFRLSSSDHAWDQIQELTAVAHYRNVLEVLVGVNGCVQGERSIDYVEPEHATDGQTESSVEQHDREPNCIADDPDLLVVA